MCICRMIGVWLKDGKEPAGAGMSPVRPPGPLSLQSKVPSEQRDTIVQLNSYFYIIQRLLVRKN